MSDVTVGGLDGQEGAAMNEEMTVVPAVLGWSNGDTGPASVRVYATDRGDSPRWAKPRARVIEDALLEAGCHEGDRIAVVVLGDRFTERTPDDVQAALSQLSAPPEGDPERDGAQMIVAERRRHAASGYTSEHDAEHADESLALAACSYAIPRSWRRWKQSRDSNGAVPTTWPWDARRWRPTQDDRVRELVKAGALIAAEIDRLIAGGSRG
jgi:hypothetical protein